MLRILGIHAGECRIRRAALHLDILVYAWTGAQQDLTAALRQQIQLQLLHMKEIMLRSKAASSMSALHFKPADLSHHITLVKQVHTSIQTSGFEIATVLLTLVLRSQC